MSWSGQNHPTPPLWEHSPSPTPLNRRRIRIEVPMDAIQAHSRFLLSLLSSPKARGMSSGNGEGESEVPS